MKHVSWFEKAEKLRLQGYSYADIAQILKITTNVVAYHLSHIKKGRLSEQLQMKQNSIEPTKGIRFGVVSDTHLCSRYQQLTFLKDIYKLFETEGIENVYHAGDITEGYYKNRAGHEYEIFKHGIDQQADYVIKEYPKIDDITTHFITGNHDATHLKNGGSDIGKIIANARSDMKYLGPNNAKVFLSPNCIMELNHPGDGASYAISHAIQKTIDAMNDADRPHILLNGHHHKALYINYRNIHAFECGTTEAQSPWMKSKRLTAHVGAWIINICLNDTGFITRCQGEFIPCNEIKINDY